MRVAQEPDQVNARVIITIAVLAALITAGGAGAAWLLARSGERSIGVGPSESIVARWGHPPEERNAIETSLFGPPSASPRDAGAYGWRDRQLGTVFIPIERAMLLYVARAAEVKGGAEPPAPGGTPRPSPPARTTR